MSRFIDEPDYAHGEVPCAGVLLTNLGSPAAPTARELRRFLGEFLWDPRVVETPRALWWLILHGVILRVRPRRSAHAYRTIWTEDGSPLLAIAKRQAQALQEHLEQRAPGPVRVELGMRYGSPSIAHALARLRESGARRLLVLPMYPQYSATTTASTFDALAADLEHRRWLPELRMVMHYHDEPGYIEALAQSVEEHWRKHGQSERLLFSFHGLPRRYLDRGDPYHCHCHKTARLVAERLGLSDTRWRVAFQSRFGREQWLQPYTDETLRSWAHEGVGSVEVICPGFSADCLETLEEIEQQNRRLFLSAGGQSFHYIPALNDRDDHMTALAALALRHMQEWPEIAPDWNQHREETAAEVSRQRALAHGAPR